MSELHPLIQDLALTLVVAGIVTIIFKRLRQPLVLGYIMAGFLVSPHMPYTMSIVDRDDIQTWADIGVIFLLFSLGLDFSFKKIMKMGISPAIAATTIISSMVVLGIVTGRLFGWTTMDSLFLGGMLAMSSTTIIYKAFDDMGLRQQAFAQMVMSVLILEDILAIVMMVLLSAVAGGDAINGSQLLGSVVSIAFFLVLWFVVGIFAVPLFLRSVRRFITGETLLIVSLGLCCFMAVLSAEVGFSAAFGAFVMGSILAETIEADKIARLVDPVKNLFGAVFFVSVGMLVDPQVLVDYALPIVVITLVIIIGQSVFGSLGYLLSGQPLSQAMRCGFSMAQIGEFAFIIASLGLSLGVISQFLYPVVVAVSVVTTFLTPYMIRLAEPAYKLLERRMPKSLVRNLNRFYHDPSNDGQVSESAKTVWKDLLASMLANTVIYSTLTVAVIILSFMFLLPLLTRLLAPTGIGWLPSAVCGVVVIALISPFLRSIIMKKNHSDEFRHLWAERAVNRVPLFFTIVVRCALAVGFVFYVVNRLTNLGPALLITIALVAVSAITASRWLKKRSIQLERLFVQNLRSRDIEAQVHGRRRPLYEGHLLDRHIHIAEFDVPEDSSWAGQRLSDLRTASRFAVHVSSILRGRRRINIPGGDDIVFPGDRLQVIGNDRQLAAFGQALKMELVGEDPDVEKREMKLRQKVIAAGSPFVGKTLNESGIRDRYGCMVVGLEAGQDNLAIVNPNHRFAVGDIVWIVGEEESLSSIP